MLFQMIFVSMLSNPYHITWHSDEDKVSISTASTKPSVNATGTRVREMHRRQALIVVVAVVYAVVCPFRPILS